MPENRTAWVLDSDGAPRVGRAVCVAVAADAVDVAAAELGRRRTDGSPAPA